MQLRHFWIQRCQKELVHLPRNERTVVARKVYRELTQVQRASIQKQLRGNLSAAACSAMLEQSVVSGRSVAHRKLPVAKQLAHAAARIQTMTPAQRAKLRRTARKLHRLQLEAAGLLEPRAPTGLHVLMSRTFRALRAENVEFHLGEAVSHVWAKYRSLSAKKKAELVSQGLPARRPVPGFLLRAMKLSAAFPAPATLTRTPRPSKTLAANDRVAKKTKQKRTGRR